MTNPITDGQLQDETPPLAERLLAALIAIGIVFVARKMGILSWSRFSGLSATLLITSTACVWFPEYIAALASISSASDAEVPAQAVRMIGWCLLLTIGLALGAMWGLGQ
jgi:hypothetical protein